MRATLWQQLCRNKTQHTSQSGEYAHCTEALIKISREFKAGRERHHINGRKSTSFHLLLGTSAVPTQFQVWQAENCHHSSKASAKSYPINVVYLQTELAQSSVAVHWSSLSAQALWAELV